MPEKCALSAVRISYLRPDSHRQDTTIMYVTGPEIDIDDGNIQTINTHPACLTYWASLKKKVVSCPPPNWI